MKPRKLKDIVDDETKIISEEFQDEIQVFMLFKCWDKTDGTTTQSCWLRRLSLLDLAEKLRSGIADFDPKSRWMVSRDGRYIINLCQIIGPKKKDYGNGRIK